MGSLELPGLDRLVEVCLRLKLAAVTCPPGNHPPAPFSRVAGVPLDPVLASFYSRMGRGMFAADADGLGLFEVGDDVNELEERNQELRAGWQREFFSNVFVFGGEPGLAHYYATVPGLADGRGRQPVVWVDAYEQPYALPVASDLDRLFDTYSRYLEELVAHEDFEEHRSAALTFPWKVPALLSRDVELVRLVRERRFDSLLPGEEGLLWAARILAASPLHS